MRCILCILSVCIVGFCLANEESGNLVMMDELKLAKEQAELENSSLKQELAGRDAEILRLRSMYADSVLQTNQLVRKLTMLELEATNLLSEREVSKEGQLADTLAVIAALRERILGLERALGEAERQISTGLDALKASEALRTEITRNLENVRKEVSAALNLLSGGTGDGVPAVADGIEIAALDGEAQVVYLNRGFRHDLRIGQTLCLIRNGEVVARVKLVECRPEVSAGIMIEGNWNALYAGCRLRKESISR